MTLAARVATAAHKGGPRFLDRRFDGAGRVVSCPGNTIIAHIRAPEVLDHLTAAQARLAETEAGACFAWLPRASLHCTLFNGLLYAERAASHWPKGLALDAQRAAADHHMRVAHDAVEPPPTPFALTPSLFSGQADDALGLGLIATADSEPAMRGYRDALARAAGLSHRPGHAAYRFHITFAYLIAWPSLAAAEDFDSAAEDVLTGLATALPEIVLDRTEYCVFEGMMHFEVMASKPLALRSVQ